MANIPIFIPHVGCKNDCAFCNQKSITGKIAPPTFEEADNIIKENLATLKDVPSVAFFGGSFTAIEEEKQIEVAPKIEKSRTLVPIAVLRDLGLDVEWNAEKRTVTVRG